MLRYKPDLYSANLLTPRDVAEYTYNELNKLASALATTAEMRQDVNYREPTKPREAQLTFADGSTWNPGDGQGYYFYTGAAWRKLYSQGSIFLAANGSAGAPSYSWVSDTDTGFFWSTADNIDVSLGSSVKYRFASDFLNFTSSIGLRFWSGAGAFSGLLTTLVPEATGIVAQRDGANAQVYRVYNTFTDASNYRRLVLDTTAGNLVLAGESAGTGGNATMYVYNRTDGDLYLGTNNSGRWIVQNTGHFIAGADNTYDIGAAAARPRDFHLARNAFIAGNLSVGHTGTAEQIVHVSTSGSSAQVVLERTGGSAGKWAIGADNVGFSVFLPPAYTRPLVLTSNGHLGIGGTPTNFPGYGVVDAFNTSGAYVLARDSASAVIGQLLGDAGTSFVYVGSRTNNGLIFTTNNTEKARITAVGHFQSIVSIGYGSTAGGTVTQITSKSTAVTLNKICGQITTHNAALAAGAEVAFTVNNSTVAATDVPIVAMASGGTTNSYNISVNAVAAGSFVICITNLSAGSLSQALVINFAIIKAVNA